MFASLIDLPMFGFRTFKKKNRFSKKIVTDRIIKVKLLLISNIGQYSMRGLLQHWRNSEF